MSSGPTPSEALQALHAEVDARVLPLAELHTERLQCRKGCADCCTDGITVFEIEAARILAEAGPVLRSAPHPQGACAFLDGEGACRIYAQRPYVCRTQGLPLRWLEDREGETVELRDICPLNDGSEHPPLEALEPTACWSIGPFEGRLARLQEQQAGGSLRRVPLRRLFHV